MEKPPELRPFQNQTDVDVLHSGIEIKGAILEVEPRGAYDGDEYQLARLGKKQRNFGFWAPTAGGQYHWAAILAPKSSKGILSYITGWLIVLGWRSSIAAGSYLTGTTIQGVVVLTSPTYNPKTWHGTLLTWAVVIAGLGINTLVSRVLAKIETLILILHIVGFVAILMPLVYLAPHSSPQLVITEFVNARGWPTQGLSFFVGIVGSVVAFLGTNGAIHISEEVKNAAIVVPRSMIMSVLINGALGFDMLVAMVFCLGNIEKISSTPPTQYQFMAIFAQAAGSSSEASGMIAVIIFIFIWIVGYRSLNI
ncbi:MAG: hypothetical protein ASARMPRED_003557 [Alectoria sarmentosa]|nr:MAG: hypothetical protein ASARMPRED_003557 [Alectoria sarmentosa]